MGHIARYTIILDRYVGEDDYFEAHHGDGTLAAEQVARELQEAMNISGLPVGLFAVTSRYVFDENDPIPSVPPLSEMDRVYVDDPGGKSLTLSEFIAHLTWLAENGGPETANAKVVMHSDDLPDDKSLSLEQRYEAALERKYTTSGKVTGSCSRRADNSYCPPCKAGDHYECSNLSPYGKFSCGCNCDD